jgi:hypothetical protein
LRRVDSNSGDVLEQLDMPAGDGSGGHCSVRYDDGVADRRARRALAPGAPERLRRILDRA